VQIAQATGVPGTATITATGPDGIVATYTVNFAPAATSDEFDGTALGPQWTVVRQNSNLSIGGGSLTITPEAGQLTTNNATTAKNLVLEPAFGNFYETTKLTFDQRPNAATQQAGLLVYQDDDNYLKFDVEATSATNLQFSTSLEDTLNSNLDVSASPIQVDQTLNTTSANAIWPAGNTIWLRVSRKGTQYTTAYSLDGTTWTTVWSNGATLTNPRVGVYSYSAAAPAGALTASFDFFHVYDPVTDPVTTAAFAPATVHGWFPQDPTVTLTATDNSGLGIAGTSYRIDGGAWQTYAAPFTITGDGTHLLEYYSTDNFGDVETTRSTTVQIDTTQPVVAYTGNAGTYTPFQTVSIHCSATDPTPGSGIDPSATSCVDVNGPAYSFGLGPHTFDATATDLAGNTASTSTTFTVTTGGCLGNSNGAITVRPGQSLCIAPGAKVSGPLTVNAGGTLYADGAAISGPVRASGAALVRLCGTSISGPLSIDSSTGIVVVGGDAATGPCRQHDRRPGLDHRQHRRRRVQRQPRPGPAHDHRQHGHAPAPGHRLGARDRQHGHGPGQGPAAVAREARRGRAPGAPSPAAFHLDSRGPVAKRACGALLWRREAPPGRRHRRRGARPAGGSGRGEAVADGRAPLGRPRALHHPLGIGARVPRRQHGDADLGRVRPHARLRGRPRRVHTCAPRQHVRGQDADPGCAYARPLLGYRAVRRRQPRRPQAPRRTALTATTRATPGSTRRAIASWSTSRRRVTGGAGRRRRPRSADPPRPRPTARRGTRRGRAAASARPAIRGPRRRSCTARRSRGRGSGRRW
jgi:regulation of enolase protein 1 (concanavalin A-like superfamily)